MWPENAFGYVVRGLASLIKNASADRTGMQTSLTSLKYMNSLFVSVLFVIIILFVWCKKIQLVLAVPSSTDRHQDHE